MENSSRFNHVLQQLCGANGCAVYSMDHRNHGHSSPGGTAPSGFFDEWGQVTGDWADFCAFVTRRQASQAEAFPVGSGEATGEAPPLFLAGVSFGGMLTIHTLLREPSAATLNPAGVVLLAPFIDVPRPLVLRIQEALAPMLLALGLGRVRLVDSAQPEKLSTHPKVVEGYVGDPLNIRAKIALRPGYLLGQACYWLKEHRGEFAHPLLCVHGSEDKCTSYPHALEFVENVASKDKAFVSVEGGDHLIMHGPEQAFVVKTVADWIDARS
jgi:alpha-beta hydrolase superfamily lysophospholipase